MPDDICTITGMLRKPNGSDAQAHTSLTIMKAVKSGSVITLSPVTVYVVGNACAASFTAIRASRVWLQSEANTSPSTCWKVLVTVQFLSLKNINSFIFNREEPLKVSLYNHADHQATIKIHAVAKISAKRMKREGSYPGWSVFAEEINLSTSPLGVAINNNVECDRQVKEPATQPRTGLSGFDLTSGSADYISLFGMVAECGLRLAFTTRLVGDCLRLEPVAFFRQSATLPFVAKLTINFRICF